jgi:tetratricopeptide (TPR) repeat protein
MVFNRMAQLARPFQIEAALSHWQRVIAITVATEKTYEQLPHKSAAGRKYFSTVMLHPWLALAKARTGDMAAAEGLIAPTPADCYDCVRIRGMIASEAKQWGRADGWFAKAVQDAPSIPFAYEDWGRSLLERGQADAAVEKFKRSSEKGPHFADALEGWGEALMAKNQSHLALVKFAEAEKYAPNWGRLHLKWGEALAYAGKKDEARAQFTRAAQLDLTPSEKSELAGYP